MITKMFSVYDSKTEAYMAPFFMGARGQAIRSFVDTAGEGTSMIAKHPEDFTLFELGDFDDATASLSLHPTPVSLGIAIELLPKK